MKLHIKSVILLAAAMLAGGCVDDDLQIEPGIDVPGDNDGSPLQLVVESYDVSVQNGSRASEPSNVPEPVSEDEKRIQDFWMFQFNPDGTKLKDPIYYELTGTQVLKDLTTAAYADLTKDTPMTIYIVTNTHNSTWATGTGFDTLEGVKAQKLPNPYPIRVLADETRTDDVIIPMSGQLDNVTVKDKTLVVVPVIRMYAKIKVKVNFNVADMTIYDVNICGIPWYCRVTTENKGIDANGEPLAVDFPENTPMISRAFSSADAVSDESGHTWLILYTPENIRGEVAGADKLTSQNIPEDALEVQVRAKYDGMDFHFNIYPGENSKNNFNVRRNCVYRVDVDVNSAKDQHNPSSNCFIVKPEGKLSFEPYNRVETGGGYNFGDYLNPDVEDLRIDTTEIVWQTKDCIGDNTNGKRMKFTLDEKNPIYSKITVLTGKEGNALIAARNSKGEIIWSWHIWVTENEPDNLREAIVYKTYAWDENGIKNRQPRIPGYGVMPCNLGALAYKVGSVSDVRVGNEFPREQLNTFGMLYQWGRKDPFPPLIRLTNDTYTSNSWLSYNEDNTGPHYGNNNMTRVGKTSAYDESKLFYSITKADVGNEEVKYAIAHPTVYIAGTSTLNNPGGWGLQDPNSATFTDEGNWCPHEESNGDKLWGGLEINGSMKKLLVETKQGESVYLYDNYGTEKSIFDPCPTGWRVAPPDLWLGFTDTGLNPVTNGTRDMSHVNYNSGESDSYGLSMYMREWRNGPTSYFPTQGTITVNGRGYHVGYCGNYHNATCSDNQRVNILHIHDNSKLSTMVAISGGHFHIFETEFKNYYVKSTAGPVRCVRDRK